MKTFRILIIVWTILGLSTSAQNLPDLSSVLGSTNQSQNRVDSKSIEVQRMLQQRAAEKVGLMTDYIQFMADKSKPLNSRKYYREKALGLFIGMGYGYEQDGIHKDGVYMETTSVFRKNPTRRLIRDYFTGLINLRYDKVTIESTDVSDIKVSNLKKISETDEGTVYECTCYFEQAFIGYRDGVPVYKDITRKKVTCRVLEQETVDGNEYVVFLGDVTTLDTRKG